MEKEKKETKAQMHLSSLHAYSTRHEWVFGAFAEIIDNACNAKASEIWIDTVDMEKTTCLTFLDNGPGMEAVLLYNMLSLQGVRQCRNDLRSSSMRIGSDVLVFTRSAHTASIGFLSQTYLKALKATSIYIPILKYSLPELKRVHNEKMQKHLDAILKFSVYSDEEELKKELQALGRAKTGTKIVISNLSRLKNGNLELDFSSDKEDIRCCGADTPSEVHHTFEYRQSLREYCSLLYLKPRVKIIIRGKKVKSKLISKSLTHSRTDAYAPRELRRPVEITFGFSAKKRRDKNNCLMFYHENRLIKVFERPGYQGNPMSKWIHTDGYGTGLVGVASVDFLEPSNNKQDFVRDSKFTQTMRNIVLKLNKYWDEMEPVVSKQSNISLPDETWAQCDKCLKWRHLPDRVNPETLPDEWTCADNPDVTHNRCINPEELEDIYDPDNISLKRMSARKAVAKSVCQKSLPKAKEKSSPYEPIGMNRRVLWQEPMKKMPTGSKELEAEVDTGFERVHLKRRLEEPGEKSHALSKAKEKSSPYEPVGMNRILGRVGRVLWQEPMKKMLTGSKESEADVDTGFVRVHLKRRLEEPGEKSHALSKESGLQLGQSGITGNISQDKLVVSKSELALPKHTTEQKAKAKKSMEKLMPSTFKRGTAKPDFEEFLYEPIKPKPTRPFKVWNFDRTVKKSVMAISFEDFIKKGCSKLGLTERPRIVLEEDGTEVDDDDYFSFLPDDSIFLLLQKGETWQPAKKVGEVPWDVTDHGSGPGLPEEQVIKLAQCLKTDMSRIITFSSEQLQELVDADKAKLAQGLGQCERYASSLQEACQRYLDDRARALDTADLLQLYHSAYQNNQAGKMHLASSSGS